MAKSERVVFWTTYADAARTGSGGAIANNPYTTRRPKPDRDLWAAYEAANRRAAVEYEARKRRNGLPGCAGGCGTAVHTEGRTCVVCQVRR